jgi:hypothetical protein
MAHSINSQKEKVSNQRQDCFPESITLPVGTITDFYRIVKYLNIELGHGNWTTDGRPVRRIRRYDSYNKVAANNGFINNKRTLAVTFLLPNNSNHLATRLFLELN